MCRKLKVKLITTFQAICNLPLLKTFLGSGATGTHSVVPVKSLYWPQSVYNRVIHDSCS